ncbi:PPOX class F420-dependent oxidoreductase [Actinoplanes sp. NPDC004185]
MQTEEKNPLIDLLRARSGSRGVLVTIKRDGRPQMSNVGYSYDEDAGIIRIAVTEERAKTRNLARDPRANFYVSTEDLGTYIVCECTAELSPVAADPDDATVDELVQMYRATQGEHPDWEEFRRTKVADRRMVVRLHVARSYGFAMPSF